MSERRILLLELEDARRRDRMGGVRRVPAADLHAGDRSTPRGSRSANGSRRDSLGRPLAASLGGPRHPRPRHSRPQHGQGRARDGLLGTRRGARARPALARCSAERATASRPESRSAFSRRRTASSIAPLDAVAAGYRKIKLKIQPGQDVDVRARGARRARTGRRPHGRRERRVLDRRRRAPRRARRVRPRDARAAVRRRRVVAARRVAATDDDADLPRRVDRRRHRARTT